VGDDKKTKQLSRHRMLLLFIRSTHNEVKYTGWPKLKYPSSKFAIFWQQHKILRPIL